jgi:Tol biopolymer transport system component
MRTYWLIFLLVLFSCATPSPETADSPTVTPAPSGKLIFTQLEPGELNLVQMDVDSGDVTTLFAVPDNAWLAFTDVSPDHNQILMAYAPAPPPGEIQFGYTNLYTMLLGDGSAPRPLVPELSTDEILFDPVWSPDGRTIYYSHVVPDDNSNGFVTYLERLDNETGEQTIVADDAIWPRSSPDGTQLAYVTVDPETAAQALIVADADGTNPVSLLPPEMFEAADVPFFSPDGTMVYFSGATAAEQSWWDQLLGVKIASAHNLPSDWWRVPVTGGTPERITDIDDVGLFGTFSPDGRSIAYISQSGVYLMNPDGTDRRQLLETTAVGGISWIP